MNFRKHDKMDCPCINHLNQTGVRLYENQPCIYIRIEIKLDGTQPCRREQRKSMMGISYIFQSRHE